MTPDDIKSRLGLPEDATDQDIIKALDQAKSVLNAFQEKSESLHLHARATPQEVVRLMSQNESEIVTGLREQITTMGQQVGSLKNKIMRADAVRDMERFAPDAIITEPMKETLIKMHIEDKEGAIQLMSALPNAKHLTQNTVFGVATSGASLQLPEQNSGMDAEIKRNMA
ncbi:MAG: hypothetical protein ACTINM_03205 [Acetobacter cibinongensis]